jgi:hypothetical protein
MPQLSPKFNSQKRSIRRVNGYLLGKPASGAAGGFGVGSVAGFFDAIGTNGVGMCGGPAVGA